jgi:hypothetical protein
MAWIWLVAHLMGTYPLWRCWRANRATSLAHAVVWVIVAWFAWGFVWLYQAIRPDEEFIVLGYLALCFTSCAAMAVLGARWPGVGAWNLVVAGLFAILLLPLAEGWGELHLTTSRIVFVLATLSVIPFNYTLTRLGSAALAVFVGCGIQVAALFWLLGSSHEGERFTVEIGQALIVLSPWFGFVQMTRFPKSLSRFDRTWLDFRDRFGMIWALRVREQFNRAAANAGWPIRLNWSGLNNESERTTLPALHTLEALLKRFGPAIPQEQQPY